MMAQIGLLLLCFMASTPVWGQDIQGGLDSSSYAAVLRTYVDGQGLVDYRGLKAHSTDLKAFLKALETLDPKVYEGWTDKEQIAFWINTYNALTLWAIITHYPIKPSFFASFYFPKNSIRQIAGVWDELRFKVMGRERTLDEIEHQILRSEFEEPRIHMALVCAARGCPPLRREPYTAERLDEQLADQARRFLRDPLKFRIDRQEGRVYLSPIFKWFGKDFAKKYQTHTLFAEHEPTERAVLHFISHYLGEEDRHYLRTASYAIAYLPYDWSLNEKG